MIEIRGYRLLRQLGRGGMATVYLAMQESVDREVALKVMSPALLADPNFGERFLREAKIAAKLHHRHVVGIHDVGRSGDYHYIAMEYLGGGPVLPKDGRPRDAAFALRVIREIAGALHYAHEKGYVHRDVKADNILLRADGSAVLTDFGIARALDAAQGVTSTGAVVGTPHYMSPEQARGKPIDGRSDLYALGVVLYELLVGRVPYHAGDSLAVGIMHITEPVPRLPDALAPLQPLVDRLLAKQPDDRFQDGNEVAAAIAAIEGRRRAGASPEDVAMPNPFWREAADTPGAADAPPAAGLRARERAEPNLGRIDQIGGHEDVERLEQTIQAAQEIVPLALFHIVELERELRRGGLDMSLFLDRLVRGGLFLRVFADLRLRRLDVLAVDADRERVIGRVDMFHLGLFLRSSHVVFLRVRRRIGRGVDRFETFGPGRVPEVFRLEQSRLAHREAGQDACRRHRVAVAAQAAVNALLL